jgi:hypothetical protein
MISTNRLNQEWAAPPFLGSCELDQSWERLLWGQCIAPFSRLEPKVGFYPICVRPTAG